MRILITGAGIAGPALALALTRHDRGHDVTVVEQAPALRPGGQAVDFRGEVHREVLERLDLWDDIHAERTPGMSLALRDRPEGKAVVLPSVMLSGDVEILRGDLSRLLHRRTESRACYRFAETVVALEQDAAGVDVSFSTGKRERFELVIGADGLHSGIRRLVLGDETRFVRYQGYQLATFTLEAPFDLPPRTAVSLARPGRSLTLSAEGQRYRASLMFAHPDAAMPRNPDVFLHQHYADFGWEAPRVLEALGAAQDLYTDAISTVHVPHYARGRVALLGDAAWGGTLGGQGSSLALVGAYVLGSELERHGGNLAATFGAYETLLRPYAEENQKGAMRVGGFHAPRSALGVWLRQRMYGALTSRVLIRQFEKLVKASARAFTLPRYET